MGPGKTSAGNFQKGGTASASTVTQRDADEMIAGRHKPKDTSPKLSQQPFFNV